MNRNDYERYLAAFNSKDYDAIVRLEAFRDLSRETLEANGCGEFHPMAAGDIIELRQFIFYTVADGKITQTECVMLPPEQPVTRVES